MVDAESLPWRRGRAILIALVILLLILLPLYLWPLQGDLSGLPGASALPGSMWDPRSPMALARIPSEVWDALMGRAEAPPSRPAANPSRNLTMISELEETAADGLTSSLVGQMIAELGSSDPSGESPSPSVPWLESHPGGGPGTSSPWSGFASGGYPSFGDLGPWHGGGPGGGPRFTSPPTSGPGEPGMPTPTPEPATLVLVGSNLALLGAAAWKRRRRRQEATPIG
ncbi:MAG: PEP-CTERM sorting domain-containing protein [Candidatus Rokuibacteriota bacterium]